MYNEHFINLPTDRWLCLVTSKNTKMNNENMHWQSTITGLDYIVDKILLELSNWQI